jgi:multisubunit Na+/H+ antiporter MnhE subunit
MGLLNQKLPTAIKGIMNHAKTSFSKEIFAGAINSAVQYLELLRYAQKVYFRHNHREEPGFVKVAGTLTLQAFTTLHSMAHNTTPSTTNLHNDPPGSRTWNRARNKSSMENMAHIRCTHILLETLTVFLVTITGKE